LKGSLQNFINFKLNQKSSCLKRRLAWRKKMLSYLLAIVVGLGSFSLYMAAFFFPEVYRRYDFVWSGVGMFYALVLWVCAGRITGGLLLGQIASVALLGWFGYQSLQLRREQTPIAQRTPLPASANSAWEVAQVTLQQLRASFRQSAERSPLAAQLERLMVQIEAVWQTVRSRIDALITTTLNPASIPKSENPDLGQAEFYAEWDDLEVDTTPDMETIETLAPQSSLEHPLDYSMRAGKNAGKNADKKSVSGEIPPL
jgi:hypothetical protein